MKIGFMGGTFSPPHIGHLNAAEAFYREAGLDKLIIIPAKVSPFKSAEKKLVPDSQRFEMTQLCFSSLPKAFNTEISDMEIKCDGLSYTIFTIKKLLEAYKDCTLTMYLGSDTFTSLERWKNFEEIFSLCEMFVQSREYNDRPLLEETANRYKKLYGARVTFSDTPQTVVSSTAIREELFSKNYSICKNLLTERVLRYIIDNGLYDSE